ncbi:hypothetical protein C8Q69DRAFT_508266 [Paecilomyces variotii]|uniref:Mitochondrial carrier protein PET8 n=1 Tax=Byssochlamys spectabilis TaxID=264951 RepID=A0A443HPZ9_BYSSP|nr:hypothetical protein C8Q69DRAFT_508266 [Paecilomyces variotii]RWQ93906.1 hypothetical protein C8Q69DRAFT_508266 [Paecilomyces variotii]
MSFLTTTTTRATLGSRLVALRPAYAAASPFHSSAARSALKESDQNRDELDKEYEAQKQEQLRSTKEGKAKWKQELASNSEASVKADRGEIDSNQETIDKLQEGTKNLPNREGPVNKAH